VTNLAMRARKFPELCRADLVPHQGKKALAVNLPGDVGSHLTDTATWNSIADLLFDNLEGNVKEGRASRLSLRFTTTTPARFLANRLKILDLFSPYFDYYGMASCGIPRIRLEGTPADWRLLKERSQALAACGLDPWIHELQPLLDELIRTSEGHPQLGFWKSFVRWQWTDPECGSSPWIDGWIARLQGVDDQGSVTPRPRSLDLGHTLPSAGSFDFTLLGLEGPRSFKLVSGFSGMGQDPDGTVFPELGWSAWEVPPPKSAQQPTSNLDLGP